ncbi:MAG: molybdopterin dinucleotide binding domain-containing protein [Methanosarcina flavescens]|jgi:formylmethanofuran dehydrogenase subunit D|uniref:Formylmethanofuran dehydrogenase n=1 Tax=Methanosarcina flavescens TaxID=1715806 RepID=A0A660HVK7_9EURY|nr:molybdopterin dinucleotide binding domain-containing protein [Methanosarcina flavescens]AYK16368.1 formylmethanofuran dehydrogenase [Methanosarcina flavescens]NLK32029.1 formylmethanofuran dehydrogenase [Methanosarcina flavescens]
MEVLLITGSTIDEGRLAKGGDKFTDDYTKECACCWISPADFVSLCSPDKVKVTSGNGKHSVVVYTRCTDSVQPGQVFMPRAIWSNIVIDPDTLSTGSPLYKGAPVTIEPSEEEVLSAEDVVLKVYIGGQ